MTRADDANLNAAVLDALLEVAPDIDPGVLDPSYPLREQFDFDSMDQLNFALALHARFGIDVPESDYSRLSTLAGSVAYIADAIGRRAPK